MNPYKIDKNKYPKPRELPTARFEEGIYILDYGDIYLTPAHIVYAIEEQREFKPDEKLPVLIIAEAAGGIQKGMAEVTSSEAAISVTIAVAMVATSKLTTILGNLFLSINNNPYPTRLFTEEDKAREWLKSFL